MVDKFWKVYIRFESLMWMLGGAVVAAFTAITGAVEKMAISEIVVLTILALAGSHYVGREARVSIRRWRTKNQTKEIIRDWLIHRGFKIGIKDVNELEEENSLVATEIDWRIEVTEPGDNGRVFFCR